MGDQSMPTDFPDVQGKTPVVRFEMNDAYKYMVQILGRKEQIPRRFGDVTEGAVEILMCLKLRYGDGYTMEINSLLVWQLTICKDDQEIWGDWREKFAAQSHVAPSAHDVDLEQRILAWNDGNEGYNAGKEPSAGATIARRAPIYTFDKKFSSRADNFNGTRVAKDLAEVTERRKGLLRHFSSGTDTVHWEIKPSLGKVLEVVGKVFDKAKKNKS